MSYEQRRKAGGTAVIDQQILNFPEITLSFGRAAKRDRFGLAVPTGVNKHLELYYVQVIF